MIIRPLTQTPANPQNPAQNHATQTPAAQDSQNLAAPQSGANRVAESGESSGTNKIEDIKNRLDNGTYALDPKATSQKMAQDLLLGS